MINRYASLRQGLVGAWCPSLGASGFRLIDRSGYGNHGTLTNMDPGTDWVPSGGKLALDFDGVNDYVDAANKSAFSFGADGPFTLAAWVNLNSLPGSNIFGIIGKGTYGVNLQYNFYIGESSSQIKFTVSDGSTNTSYIGRATPTITEIGWSHFLARYTGGGTNANCSIWRNGIQIDSADFYAGTYVSMANLGSVVSIGSLNGGTNFRMSGRIDDARIYNRALTPSEIRLLYTGGRGVGIAPERIKHRRKTTAATTNRRRRLICGANC